jgi:hypothetical protein
MPRLSNADSNSVLKYRTVFTRMIASIPAQIPHPDSDSDSDSDSDISRNVQNRVPHITDAMLFNNLDAICKHINTLLHNPNSREVTVRIDDDDDVSCDDQIVSFIFFGKRHYFNVQRFIYPNDVVID